LGELALSGWMCDPECLIPEPDSLDHLVIRLTSISTGNPALLSQNGTGFVSQGTINANPQHYKDTVDLNTIVEELAIPCVQENTIVSHTTTNLNLQLLPTP
jgi:hypothetical protein